MLGVGVKISLYPISLCVCRKGVLPVFYMMTNIAWMIKKLIRIACL